MKKGFEIEIRPDRKAMRTLKLLEEWPARTDRLIAQLVLMSAEYIRGDLLERLPKTEEWASYRDSLEVVRVLGGPKEVEAVYAVRSNPKSRRIRMVDAPKTVLYIRSKPHRLKRVKPEISTLEKYSPWTLQTLPFMPDRRDAVIVSRRATKAEVQRVNKARLADRSKWRRELGRAGIRQTKLDNVVKIPKRAKALPDVAFQALRLEFGLGTKPKAHWRPAIRSLIRSGLKDMVRQDDSIKKTLTRAGYREWRNWPRKIKGKVRIGEARGYLPFQKKLGIRISRS